MSFKDNGYLWPQIIPITGKINISTNSAAFYFTMAVCNIFNSFISYSHLKNVKFKRKIIVTTVLDC